MEQKRQSKRGGTRPGAGRPRTTDGRITVRLPEDLLLKLKEYPSISKVVTAALRLFFSMTGN